MGRSLFELAQAGWDVLTRPEGAPLPGLETPDPPAAPRARAELPAEIPPQVCAGCGDGSGPVVIEGVAYPCGECARRAKETSR